ncbi:MAG: hypothetical protein UHS41_09045 [Lachnospiraceae bacterium]|nr:hypothetical protein [Lachnospiraceae bacterium]
MKKLLTVGLCICLACTVIGCGKKKEDTEKTTTEKTETTTEDKELEEVTELEKENDEITFGEIETGLNFKAKGSEIAFKFEDMSEFDNSLEMVFSLTDATNETEPVELKISKLKKKYTFKGLEKGKDYYLEVYPTKTASSDEEFKKITNSNSQCKLTIIQ